MIKTERAEITSQPSLPSADLLPGVSVDFLRKYFRTVIPDQEYVDFGGSLVGPSAQDIARFGFDADMTVYASSRGSAVLRSVARSGIFRVAAALGAIFVGGNYLLRNIDMAEASVSYDGLGFSGVYPEFQPNLNPAELCQKVVVEVTVRDFEEANNKVGYQEGEDKVGEPIPGAKLQWMVNGQDIGGLVETNNKGKARKAFDSQPCNDADGTRLITQAEIILDDRRTALRTFNTGNGMTGYYIAWIEKGGAATATTTPAATRTPDATTTSTPTVGPATSPTPGAGAEISPTVTPTADTTPTVTPTPTSTTTTEVGPIPGANLSEEVGQLKENVNKLGNDLTQLQQDSNNRTVLAGLGIVLGLSGLLTALGTFIWARRGIGRAQEEIASQGERVEALENTQTELGNRQTELEQGQQGLEDRVSQLGQQP